MSAQCFCTYLFRRPHPSNPCLFDFWHFLPYTQTKKLMNFGSKTICGTQFGAKMVAIPKRGSQSELSFFLGNQSEPWFHIEFICKQWQGMEVSLWKSPVNSIDLVEKCEHNQVDDLIFSVSNCGTAFYNVLSGNKWRGCVLGREKAYFATVMNVWIPL